MKPWIAPLAALLGLVLLAADVPREIAPERPDDPPGRAARDNLLARSPGRRVVFGSYLSVQVNVDALGRNIVGDAANEPSLAVHPTSPRNMVVGWRQFDTVASNFRQAGWAYTFDGGRHWSFPGVLQRGVFRSDPVVDVAADGTFYYQSLRADFSVDVFRSTTGGISWLPPVAAYGGDKNWMAVDRSGGASDGQVYGIWQRFFGCCGPSVLTRSTDAGASFEFPVPVAFWPTFGTLAVGPHAELVAAGIDGTNGQDTAHFVVARSTDAADPTASPSFSGRRVELGGSMEFGGPNPVGLLGQANVAVASDAVYLLASVRPEAGGDPLDVHFARSADGGATWSAPSRVNDDAAAAESWQWLAAHAVAPNGRIDVIWNDTRDSGIAHVARLYYAYSWDGGLHWSANVPASPPFDTTLGYPRQNKMGDYDSIVSDPTGADVAYTATFNGEQDIYYVRVFPDCNGNVISDVTDIARGVSLDRDADHVPDECAGSGLSVPGS
ncbi:MAG TPA: sialidase family protein [Candidatus Polarisedimenticolaceae bacterium]|nr:sialidase family protein [Candidatus Polarisedimenticolaceae bacterium]